MYKPLNMFVKQTERGLFSKSEWFIKADDLFSTPTIIKADKQKVRIRNES